MFVRHLATDLYYTIKSLFSAFSGFERLEVRDEEGWDEITTQNPFEEPFWVCARFRNGRHLPLPLVLGERSEYPLQNLILHTLRRLGFLREAQAACERYVSAYRSDLPHGGSAQSPWF